MNCGEIREYLNAYLDSELVSPERESMLDHLQGCEGCRHRLGALRETSRLFRQLPASEAPVGFEESLVERLPGSVRPTTEVVGSGGRIKGSQAEHANRKPVHRRAWALPIAAALLSVLGLVWWREAHLDNHQVEPTWIGFDVGRSEVDPGPIPHQEGPVGGGSLTQATEPPCASRQNCGG